MGEAPVKVYSFVLFVGIKLSVFVHVGINTNMPLRFNEIRSKSSVYKLDSYTLDRHRQFDYLLMYSLTLVSTTLFQKHQKNLHY